MADARQIVLIERHGMGGRKGRTGGLCLFRGRSCVCMICLGPSDISYCVISGIRFPVHWSEADRAERQSSSQAPRFRPQ